MPEHTFFPYELASEGLEVAVAKISLDGVAVETVEIVDVESNTIELSSRPDWHTSTIDLHVSDPNGCLPPVLFPGETPSEAIAVHAIVRGTWGRVRTGCRLEPNGEDSWVGTLELTRDSHRRACTIDVFATRVSDAEGSEQLAYRAGERVATSGRWTVYIDDRPAMPGGAIDSEWRDFGAEGVPRDLQLRRDCCWCLDLSSRDRPRLYMNEAISGLKSAVEAPARRGLQARIRDALVHSMLQPILLELAVVTLADDSNVVLDDLRKWERNYLLQLAHQIETKTEEATVESWLSNWRDGDSATVTKDLTMAVQRHLSMPRAAEQLIKQLGKDT